MLDGEGVGLPEARHSHLQRAKLPLHRYWWRCAPRPGFYRDLAFDEYAARRGRHAVRPDRGQLDLGRRPGQGA
eukprot:10101537-Lingulodinium_polyedra.AAC.1